MFIDEIEQRYSKRTLALAKMEHSGFTIVFDLPKKHHLQISISAYERNEKLLVFESVQETSQYRMHFSQGEDYTIDGDMSSILPTLQGYLQKAIGGVEHTYKGSFVGWIVEQWMSLAAKEQLSDERGGERMETGGGE